MSTEALISSHPDVGASVNEALVHAVEATLACALSCSVCADACLAEDGVRDLVQCIRLDQDCADVCRLTALLAARRSGSNEALIAVQLDVCMRACLMCAEECRLHADMHEHCRLCAEACEACATACRQARDTFADIVH